MHRPHLRLATGLLASLSLLWGCGTAPSTGQNPEGEQATQTANKPEPAQPAGLLDLALAELAREKGEQCFSPAGLAYVVGLAKAGAEGQTLAELEAIPMPQLETKESPKLTLSVANALWADQGFGLAPAYLKRVEEEFAASATNLPLLENPAKSAEQINAWVAKETRGRIARVVDEKSIANSELILSNAIYFKGQWAAPFNPDDTKEETFHGRGGDRKVQMMSLMAKEVKYSFGSEGSMAILPYADGEYTMSIYLAPEGKEGEMPTGEKLQELYASATDGEGILLSLPRFKVSSMLKLSGLLADMGVKQALAPGAMFGPMTGAENALYIRQILQAAEIEVNEEGAEASAATAAVAMSAALRDPSAFRADRPFLFFVSRGELSNVLFAGRME